MGIDSMSKIRRNNRRQVPKVKQWSPGRWKAFGRAVGLLAFACALAVGIPYAGLLYYDYLVEKGHFEPHDIQIRGNLRVSDAEILEVSGLEEPGVNLFELDSDALRERLLSIAWIESVDLYFSLPDAIEIVVQEREPMGIVNDGNLYVVDKQGVAIKLFAGADTLTHPIVSGAGVLERADVVKEAFGLAQMVQDAGFGERIDEVHYEDATGYTLFTAHSEIRMGFDRFEERITRLLEVDDILLEQAVVADYILLDSDKDLDSVVISARPDEMGAETESGQEASGALVSSVDVEEQTEEGSHGTETE